MENTMNCGDAVRVDRTQWDREEIFAFFSRKPVPFYAISFTVDVTRLVDFCHEKGVSFYLSLVHLVTRAMNSVENFRYTIRDGEVWLLKARYPSYTDLHRGSAAFHIVTPDWYDSMEIFAREAAARSAAQKHFMDLDRESDALFFASCVPGLRMTAVASSHPDPDESCPALTWGRYETRDGRTELNMTVEVNHRFVDGLHVTMFARALGELIEGL